MQASVPSTWWVRLHAASSGFLLVCCPKRNKFSETQSAGTTRSSLALLVFSRCFRVHYGHFEVAALFTPNQLSVKIRNDLMFKKDFNIIHDDTNVWIWRASPLYTMFTAQLWIPLRPIMMSLRACWIAWIVGVWRVLAPYEFPVSMQHPKVSELWVRLAAWQSHWFVY